MMHKELGRTGVHIPEIGIGTWNYHAGAAPLKRGLEMGASFIDTAESYGSEEAVGEAIRGIRDRVFLATKVSPKHFSAAEFRRAVEGSLRRLGTDRVDLLQLHEPNPQVPIEDTMGAMAALIDEGKIRFAGVSNFSVEQLQSAQKALGKHAIVANQVRYNLVDRTIESGLLPYCQANGVTVIAYCPLARGLDRILDCDPTGVLREVAAENGRSIPQVALNWCLCRDGVVAIPKGSSIEHVVENCGASDFRLNESQLSRIDSRILYRHRSKLDQALRKHLPGPLAAFAKRVVSALPGKVRRKIV
jgi:diketogulonate reductase-like aldo/keto reductase